MIAEIVQFSVSTLIVVGLQYISHRRGYRDGFDDAKRKAKQVIQSRFPCNRCGVTYCGEAPPKHCPFCAAGAGPVQAVDGGQVG